MLDKISREYDKSVPVRDYTDAHAHRASTMQSTDELGEAELVSSPTGQNFEETVVGAGLALRRADRDRGPPDGGRPAGPDPHSCKAAGYNWATVRAIIMSRPRAQGHVEPDRSKSLAELREAVGIDRAARGSVLAACPPGDD